MDQIERNRETERAKGRKQAELCLSRGLCHTSVQMGCRRRVYIATPTRPPDDVLEEKYSIYYLGVFSAFGYKRCLGGNIWRGVSESLL